jgi:signal transduction histidine kinase/phage shock protein PspC (stress-responsive transcriptional regulator)
MATTTHRRLTRSADDQIVAGLAGGIGNYLGIDPTLVRIAFVVLTLASGIGAVIYFALWPFIPEDTAPVRPRARARGGWDWGQAIALAAVVLGIVLLVAQLGLWFSTGLLWPLGLGAVGVALLLGRGRSGTGPTVPDGRGGRAELVAVIAGRGPGAAARLVAGAVLVVSGVGAFLATTDLFAGFSRALLAIAVLVGGLALIFGPWLWRLSNAFAAERRERIRSQERAELAAHLHDSVLQTLAMIQRKADAPREVVGLARRQERELRTWLLGDGTLAASDRGLGGAIERVAEEDEAQHGVPVDVVRVGDARFLEDGDLGPTWEAMVQATREAISNAARHSGAASVSVYVEAEPEQVTVYVRDRGRGFDRADVATDRRGLSESIEGRMTRHGGRATVRSAPGEGTEVELTMPRRSS